MVELLRRWRSDIETSGRLAPSHVKINVRWFLDEDVDTDGVGETIVHLDNLIVDATRAESEQMSSRGGDDPQPWPVLWHRATD
jgi:hypothetical protein